MKILLTGAGGFIGLPLAQALLHAGHDLLCVLRPGAPQPRLAAPPGSLNVHTLDFALAVTPRHWQALLQDVDLAINTVGIFREQGAQTFDNVHTRAPMALFDACAACGVARVLQLSALGADDGAASPFLRSKKKADDHLLGLPLEAIVVQPSLVYAADGPSARLFNSLAALPVRVLPSGTDPLLQPVHRDDVVAGLVALVGAPRPLRSGRIAFAGPAPVTLGAYLQALRRQLGFAAAAPVLRLPRSLFTGLARVAEKIPGSLVTQDAVRMLLHGNTGDATALATLLGRGARPVSQFVAAGQAEALRHAALLGWLLPCARVSLALVWLWTGVVSAGLYPVQDSYALLARVGATGAMATLLLYGAALLDFALGAATLLLPARLRRPLWLAQLALIVGYTAIITVFLPEYWLHPYGPVLKNLPMLMVIVLLYALEPPGRLRHPGPGKETWNT